MKKNKKIKTRIGDNTNSILSLEKKLKLYEHDWKVTIIRDFIIGIIFIITSTQIDHMAEKLFLRYNVGRGYIEWSLITAGLIFIGFAIYRFEDRRKKLK